MGVGGRAGGGGVKCCLIGLIYHDYKRKLRLKYHCKQNNIISGKLNVALNTVLMA